MNTYPGKGGIGFSREPAAWVAVIAAGLSIVVAFDQPWLTENQKTLWIAIADGVAALIVAWKVRPIAPSLFTYLISAGAALAAGYGVGISDSLVAAVNTFVVMLIFALTRPQQTPTASPSATAVDGTIK